MSCLLSKNVSGGISLWCRFVLVLFLGSCSAPNFGVERERAYTSQCRNYPVSNIVALLWLRLPFTLLVTALKSKYLATYMGWKGEWSDSYLYRLCSYNYCWPYSWSFFPAALLSNHLSNLSSSRYGLFKTLNMQLHSSRSLSPVEKWHWTR